MATRRFEQDGLEIKAVIVNAVEKPANGPCSYGNHNYKSIRQGFGAPCVPESGNGS